MRSPFESGVYKRELARNNPRGRNVTRQFPGALRGLTYFMGIFAYNFTPR